MDSLPTTNSAKGDATSTKEQVLGTGAGLTQDFSPLRGICAHLNAFHADANDATRAPVEANHYCAHVNEDVRQCLLYDGAGPNARLIGVEYMVSERVFSALPAGERELWHSHAFEVKSGMLIMPTPRALPTEAWEVAETEEMKAVVRLYGKVYHLWQTDLGHEVPMGQPRLMTSYTDRGQFDFDGVVGERDGRFGVESAKKAERRAGVEDYVPHEDADAAWRKG